MVESTSIPGLPAAPGGAPNHYLAPDYDTLVDSPIVAGNPTVHAFTIDGKPHQLVNINEGGSFDGAGRRATSSASSSRASPSGARCRTKSTCSST